MTGCRVMVFALVLAMPAAAQQAPGSAPPPPEPPAEPVPAPPPAGPPLAEPAPEAPQTAAPPPTAAVAEPPVQQLPAESVLPLLGHMVRSTGDKPTDLGRIVDVLVDGNGHPTAAVLDVGGFLGVGSRKVAVAWDALTFTPGEKQPSVTIAMNAGQIKSAPQYDPGKPVQAVSLPRAETPAAAVAPAGNP